MSTSGVIRPVLAALVCALLLTACEAGNVPLTESYRDEKLDKEAQVEYYESAALTYYEGGRFTNSIQMWARVLELEPQRKKAKWGLAQAYAGKADPRSLRLAEAYLTDVVDLDWTHPELGDRSFEVKKDLANVHSSLADYYDRDMRGLEHALANDPNADTQLLERGLEDQRAMRDVELRKAIPLYADVLKLSPNNPYAMAGLAKAHLTIGNDDVGLGWAEQYIALSQSSQKNWREQMIDWEKRAGTNMTSEQREFFLDKLQGARTKEKKIHLLVGSVYMRRGDFDLAVKSYTRVIEMDPAVPAAYIERAQAYASLRQYTLAVKDVESYLKITDPARHREERVNAAELLDRYKRILNRDPRVSTAAG